MSSLQNCFQPLEGQKLYASLELLQIQDYSFYASGHLSLPIKGQQFSISLAFLGARNLIGWAAEIKEQLLCHVSA